MNWFLYIVECDDKTLYTGITTDVKRRLFEHNNDNLRGARSTRYKRPVKLVYVEDVETQSKARIRENQIKNWKRKDKIKLIKRNNPAYRAGSSIGRASPS